MERMTHTKMIQAIKNNDTTILNDKELMEAWTIKDLGFDTEVLVISKKVKPTNHRYIFIWDEDCERFVRKGQLNKQKEVLQLMAKAIDETQEDICAKALQRKHDVEVALNMVYELSSIMGITNETDIFPYNKNLLWATGLHKDDMDNWACEGFRQGKAREGHHMNHGLSIFRRYIYGEDAPGYSKEFVKKKFYGAWRDAWRDAFYLRAQWLRDSRTQTTVKLPSFTCAAESFNETSEEALQAIINFATVENFLDFLESYYSDKEELSYAGFVEPAFNYLQKARPEYWLNKEYEMTILQKRAKETLEWVKNSPLGSVGASKRAPEVQPLVLCKVEWQKTVRRGPERHYDLSMKEGQMAVIKLRSTKKKNKDNYETLPIDNNTQWDLK